MADELVPEEATFEEKRQDGCGTLYITFDESSRVIKVLADLLVDAEKDVSTIELFGYRISAERDACCEEGLYLIKEKLDNS